MQKFIDRIAKRCKNKKVLVYGAGVVSRNVFQFYDLSKLDIVAVVDKSFENSSITEFEGHRAIPPSEIKNEDFDVVLVANVDFKYFYKVVCARLIEANLSNKMVLPLFRQAKKFSILDNFFYFFSILFNPQALCRQFLLLLTNLGTFWIIDRNKRNERVKKLYKQLSTRLYGANIYRMARYVGSNFKCLRFSNVNPNTIISDNVSFNGLNIIGFGKVVFGKNFHSGEGVLIITQTHNYDTGIDIPYDETRVSKEVIIGDYVWLGARVTILPGTRIGEGAIIQAGAVVHGEIPPYAIAGGNPAKVFKYRDIEHFERIKANKLKAGK